MVTKLELQSDYGKLFNVLVPDIKTSHDKYLIKVQKCKRSYQHQRQTCRRIDTAGECMISQGMCNHTPCNTCKLPSLPWILWIRSYWICIKISTVDLSFVIRVGKLVMCYIFKIYLPNYSKLDSGIVFDQEDCQDSTWIY